HRRVHRLSPASLHGAGDGGQPHRQGFYETDGREAAARRVCDDGDGIQTTCGGGGLCGGDVFAVPAFEPRCRGDVSIAGLEESRAWAADCKVCGDYFVVHLSRLHLDSHCHPAWLREQLRRADEMKLDSNIPSGPLAQKWDKHKFEMKLVNPANKRKFDVIVVGSGLAGASAAATMAELGYRVKCFCFQDSPRRAHSIAAQGGINAAKNYANDGDSIYRLFYDTIKGGDFRSREANVYRLAQVSVNIIDQCVAQGVPFAREYGGLLANRSFGGAQVSRTFYARGQTGQQLLLGAYQALCRQ